VISEIGEVSANEPATEELAEAELHGVTGGDQASGHVKSNCMRTASDTANSTCSNLRA